MSDDRRGADRDSDRDRDEPLGDLAAEIDERRRRRATETDDPFRDMDVGELDSEDLWASLEDDDEDDPVTVTAAASSAPDSASPSGSGSSDAETESAASTEFDAESLLGDDGGDVRTIPKRTCHGCQFFAQPPEVHCTHEGTEIIELVDRETFRVVDCPMVDDDIDDFDSDRD